jgi:hypothetical protein
VALALVIRFSILPSAIQIILRMENDKMSTAIATLSAINSTEENKAHLEDLRMACAVNDANHLVLGVESKVDAGETLTHLEYLVLWNAITDEVVQVLKAHRELLNQ